MIIDTDVLIWHFRGCGKASAFISAASPFSITVFTYMELIRGVRDKRELGLLEKVIASESISVLTPSAEDAYRAVALLKEHGLKDSLDMVDALNAAIAIGRGEAIATANGKHYAPIANLSIHMYEP